MPAGHFDREVKLADEPALFVVVGVGVMERRQYQWECPR